MKYPRNFIITSGKGESEHKLVAFDAALIRAGISNYNLIKVSSILPQNCQIKSTEHLRENLNEGSILPTAFTTISSNNPHEIISSAVAVGIPENENSIGIIMEYSAVSTESDVRATIKKMVEDAMGNHKIALKEVLISSIEAEAPEDGRYVSLVSAISIW